MKKIIVLISAAVLLAAALIVFNGFFVSQKHITVEAGLMGSRWVIRVEHSDEKMARQVVEQALKAARELEMVLSAHDAQSELSVLNDAPDGVSFKVSPKLEETLKTALNYADLTNGAFDPTLGPCIRLWKRSVSRGVLPSNEELERAKKASGYQKLHIENGYVTKTVSGMRIDLGGIGKGMAADLVARELRKSGISCFLISTSSDYLAGDLPRNRKEGWVVLLKDSSGEEKVMILENEAASTSGDLHQHSFINGAYYSHVINPETGLGLVADSSVHSVTVKARTATEADVLATACRVLPREKAEEIIRRVKGAAIQSVR